VLRRPDGDLEEEDDTVVKRYYRPAQDHRRHPHEDDDEDRGWDRSRLRGHNQFGIVSHWSDNRRRYTAPNIEQGHGSRRYREDSPRQRRNVASSVLPPPGRGSLGPDERRALHQLWKAKGELEDVTSLQNKHHLEAINTELMRASDAITIHPSVTFNFVPDQAMPSSAEGTIRMEPSLNSQLEQPVVEHSGAPTSK
jgi:hypothetical protein